MARGEVLGKTKIGPLTSNPVPESPVAEGDLRGTIRIRSQTTNPDVPVLGTSGLRVPWGPNDPTLTDIWDTNSKTTSLFT